MTSFDRFDRALSHWIDSERLSLQARLNYERAYAEALITADGKSDSIRKAQADLKSLDMLRIYQAAAIDARAAEHQVLFMRGSTPDQALEHVIELRRRYPGAIAP